MAGAYLQSAKSGGAILLAARLIACAALLGGAFALSRHPVIDADIAYFLLVARSVERGAQLYVDFRDFNLPLVHAVHLLVERLAQGLDLPAHRIYFALVALWGAAMLVAGGRLLRPLWPDQDLARALAFAGLCCLGLLSPIGDAGQRDHVAALGLLPYLLLSAVRAGPARPGGGLWLVAGLGLGIAVAFRPYYALVPLAIEAWLRLRRRRALGWPRPEAAMGALVAILVGALPLLAFQDYFANLRQFSSLYDNAGKDPAMAQLAELGLAVAFLIAASADRDRHVGAQALLVGALALFAAIALQGKWFTYHMAAFRLLAAWGVLLFLLRALPRPRRAAVLLASALAVAWLGWIALRTYRQHAVYYIAGWESQAPQSATLAAALDAAAPGGSIAVVAYAGQHYLPGIYRSSLRWSYLDQCAWHMAEASKRLAQAPGATEYRNSLDAFRAEAVSHLLAKAPDVIGILDGVGADSLGSRQDLLSWLGEDPRLRDLLSRYLPFHRSDSIQYFLRNERAE